MANPAPAIVLALKSPIGRAHIPRYVTDIPMASDYLEEGLAQCGESLVEYLDQR